MDDAEVIGDEMDSTGVSIELDLSTFVQGDNSLKLELPRYKDLESLMEEYQKLIKLNNIIEKKFQNSSKEISNKTKEKIAEIINYKNGKKIK